MDKLKDSFSTGLFTRIAHAIQPRFARVVFSFQQYSLREAKQRRHPSCIFAKVSYFHANK